MTPKFSLQSVLDLRHGRVERLEVELGKLLLTLQKTETLLQTQRETQTRQMQRLAASQQDDLNLTEISLRRADLLQSAKNIQETLSALAALTQQTQQKRAELIQARQDEETLQTLKQKRYETYQAEQTQQEARAQDDIYIALAYRTQNQPGA
jgi:flagellar export protein FliJ